MTNVEIKIVNKTFFLYTVVKDFRKYNSIQPWYTFVCVYYSIYVLHGKSFAYEEPTIHIILTFLPKEPHV